jgi:hypothetical protein
MVTLTWIRPKLLGGGGGLKASNSFFHTRCHPAYLPVTLDMKG